MKFLLILLAVLVWIEAKTIHPHCAKIHGRRCNEDSECACLNRHNKSSTLICNVRYRCKQPSFFDYISRRQPCHRIYKRFCTKDADCPCSEARLVCEDRECVKGKRPRIQMNWSSLLTRVLTERRRNDTQHISSRQIRRLLRHKLSSKTTQQPSYSMRYSV